MNESTAPSTAPGDREPGPRRVLVVGADADFGALIDGWLQSDGHSVALLPAPVPGSRPDLVLADLPFPSRAHVDSLRAQLDPQGHVPILVLSSTVFASVDCCGSAARALGADGLLPKPSPGDVLRRAVRQLIGA